MRLRGDGLFTAETDETNWVAAQRILLPTFGPAALPGMFDGMTDIADQLLLKWERQGPEHSIDIGGDATGWRRDGLTLDTIALRSFSYRFNCMYFEQTHPCFGSMTRTLVESRARG